MVVIDRIEPVLDRHPQKVVQSETEKVGGSDPCQPPLSNLIDGPEQAETLCVRHRACGATPSSESSTSRRPICPR